MLNERQDFPAALEVHDRTSLSVLPFKHYMFDGDNLMRSSFLLVCALSLICAGQELRVGVAETVLDLPEGVPLGGYGSRLRLEGPDLDPRNYHVLHHPSTGARDPIAAQALVFEQGPLSVAVICLDAIGVEGLLVDDVLQAVQKRGLPLADGQLIMAASHTHSGPGALSRRWAWQIGAVDRFNRRVHRRVVRSLAGVVEAAWLARRPARLGYGSIAVPGTTRNRRSGRSELVDGSDVDPTLRLLRVDDAKTDAPMAVLMNFAIHGTCLGGDTSELSGDVPGAIRRAVSAQLGIPVLFSNAALGDVSPSPGGERGMVEVPPQLAAAAAELLPRIETSAEAFAVAHNEHDFGLFRLHPDVGAGELEDGSWGMLAAGLLVQLGPRVGEPWLDTRFRFTALRLGELVLLCVPGEPIVELGYRLQAMGRAAGYEDAWVLGCCNGHMGYIATEEEYEQGGYEAWMTFFGPETAEQVQNQLQKAVEALDP